MGNDHVIPLSGPFRIHDSMGQTWKVQSIHIYDEGYGIIDVFVDMEASMEDAPLHEDPLVIRQILSRLRALGYSGPDFGLGEPGLQDDRLIVLEAPEEFSRFAASKGWKNLAEEYLHMDHPLAMAEDSMPDFVARSTFDALMRRLAVK